MNEKFCILIKISLKFVPKGPIDNPALVQVMPWRAKPLSEPLLTQFTDAYIGGDQLIQCTKCVQKTQQLIKWLKKNKSPLSTYLFFMPWAKYIPCFQIFILKPDTLRLQFWRQYCIFLSEIYCILIKISLKFVPKGPINSKHALVQTMASYQTGRTGSHNFNQWQPSLLGHKYQWLSARLQCLQCISNGDTAVLH